MIVPLLCTNLESWLFTNVILMDEYYIYVVLFAPVHVAYYLAPLFTCFIQVSYIKQKFPGLLISSHLRSSGLKIGFRKIVHIPRQGPQQQCDTAGPNTQNSFVGRLFSCQLSLTGFIHPVSLALPVCVPVTYFLQPSSEWRVMLSLSCFSCGRKQLNWNEAHKDEKASWYLENKNIKYVNMLMSLETFNRHLLSLPSRWILTTTSLNPARGPAYILWPILAGKICV